VGAVLQNARETGEDIDYECRILLPDGTTRTISSLGTQVSAHRGPPLKARGSCQDITERKALEAEIEYRPFHDGLTGLANRSPFMDRLEHALTVHDRSSTATTVLYADLDGLKAVNDRHGHHAGDELLIETARRLRLCARASDTLARLGGDEFAMILPGADVDDVRRVAERMHRELAAPLVVGDQPQSIAINIGIAGTNGQASDDLLREADTAMYAAKAAGRGRHETYTPGITGVRNTGAL
jgi:diguanylate cyclase (GGDEF)-like protein